MGALTRADALRDSLGFFSCCCCFCRHRFPCCAVARLDRWTTTRHSIRRNRSTRCLDPLHFKGAAVLGAFAEAARLHSAISRSCCTSVCDDGALTACSGGHSTTIDRLIHPFDTNTTQHSSQQSKLGVDRRGGRPVICSASERELRAAARADTDGIAVAPAQPASQPAS